MLLIPIPLMRYFHEKSEFWLDGLKVKICAGLFLNAIKQTDLLRVPWWLRGLGCYCTAWEVCGLNLKSAKFFWEKFQSAFLRVVIYAYVSTLTSTQWIGNTQGELFCTEVYRMGPYIWFYNDRFQSESGLSTLDPRGEEDLPHPPSYL